MNRSQRAVLWFDAGAGATVGIFVIAFREWLAELQGFSRSLVLFMGVANLAYGCYSSTLAARALKGKAPSRRSIVWLVAANGAWAFVCLAILVLTWSFVTPFGLALVTFEAVFVGSLAFAEHRLLIRGQGRDRRSRIS